jgi:ATP-dependent protease ClpP protease subunit
MPRTFLVQLIELRLFRIAACLGLAAGIIFILFCIPMASTGPGKAEGQLTAKVSVFLKDDTLYIDWSGQIAPGMADYVRGAFVKHAAVAQRVVLLLNSGGGQVAEGERVIHVLQDIGQTHRLGTAVLAGRVCASMCLPVFLAGRDRFAAPASLWLFHEVVRWDADGHAHIDVEETKRLFQQYYLPAGVAADWLGSIIPQIKNADVWRTGADLISANCGIVTSPLENRTGRVLPSRPSP